MDGIENTIEMDLGTIGLDAEICLVHWEFLVGCIKIDPFFPADNDSIGIVFLGIQKFVHHVAALDGNVVFTGVAAHDNGNVLFHLLFKISLCQSKEKREGFPIFVPIRFSA